MTFTEIRALLAGLQDGPDDSILLRDALGCVSPADCLAGAWHALAPRAPHLGPDGIEALRACSTALVAYAFHGLADAAAQTLAELPPPPMPATPLPIPKPAAAPQES